MTKSEKKVVVNNLVNGFKTTNSSSDLKTLGNKIIQEVTECPFSHENKEVFELALQFWTQHIDNYISDSDRGGASEYSNAMANLSIDGIYNFIDASLLEE
jgi:hypothetical protein